MFKLGDLYPESEKEKDQEEPDWVKNEREHFNDFRDKNKDGKMDRVCIKIMFQVLINHLGCLFNCKDHFHFPSPYPQLKIMSHFIYFHSKLFFLPLRTSCLFYLLLFSCC